MKQTNAVPKIRLFFLSMIALLFSVQVYAQQSVTLDFPQEKLSNVLKDIQKQTSYSFVYNNSLVNVNKVVSINVKDASIESVLEKLFANTPIAYKISNNQIALYPKEFDKQDSQLKGQVNDLNGEPLIGVTVQNLTQNTVTITDIDGKYSIAINPGDDLRFSYVGMTSKDVKAFPGNPLNVQLESDAIMLEKAVVIGVINYEDLVAADLAAAASSADVYFQLAGIKQFADFEAAGDADIFALHALFYLETAGDLCVGSSAVAADGKRAGDLQVLRGEIAAHLGRTGYLYCVGADIAVHMLAAGNAQAFIG
ncbi:MAG: secretin and TonB N-terminal domain-containing protein, partial [Bacteroidia bacterium]|nr:secretin and TonB N-terminal domain-containing protein [Bacteroidia bacterium]